MSSELRVVDPALSAVFRSTLYDRVHSAGLNLLAQEPFPAPKTFDDISLIRIRNPRYYSSDDCAQTLDGTVFLQPSKRRQGAIFLSTDIEGVQLHGSSSWSEGSTPRVVLAYNDGSDGSPNFALSGTYETMRPYGKVSEHIVKVEPFKG